MSDVIDFHLPPVIRIKAKHYKMLPDGGMEVEKRKFSMKRQNSSFELLRILIAKAFKISGEFNVNSRNSKNELIPLSSEWDLDVAISDSVDSFLHLIVQEQPIEKALDEWDIIGPGDIPTPDDSECISSGRSDSFIGSIISQMEKTVVKMSRALSLDSYSPEGNLPMTQTEFENFLDSEGRLVRPQEFRLAVFESGVDHNIRPEVWMHLLDVFPKGLTAAERDELLVEKSDEYFKLRGEWQKILNEGEACEKLGDITNLVQKDSTRTDKSHKFYGGSGSEKNTKCLFNILTTYAVYHPKVRYCQGMSDLLSPIFYVMRDEAQAYVAFCALLKRLEGNFYADGRSIKKKFNHLKRMLCFYDHELFVYLRSQYASDLYFTYRWLLLELKREFAYNDTLHMFEVLWASLPPKPPDDQLVLYDETFAQKEELISSMKTTSSGDNMVWINNHFGSPPTTTNRTRSRPLSKKKATRARRESELKKLFEKDSSVEDNEEIKFPIHYRKKKFRSYTARKLTLLSSSMNRQDTTMLTPKIRSSQSDSQTLCQSWACGEEFENHPIKLNTALLSAREFLRTQWCYSNTINEMQLNNWLYRNWWTDSCNNNRYDDLTDPIVLPVLLRRRHGSSDSNYSTNSEELLTDLELQGVPSIRNESHVMRSRSEGYESDNTIFTTSNMSSADNEDDSDEDDDFYRSRLADSMVGKKAEDARLYFDRKKELLPPPHLLGDGNPFLMFMCVSMIIQQRKLILDRKMEMNDLCMYFDKMVRNHDLRKVLKKARTLFADYLNMGWRDSYVTDSDKEEELSGPKSKSATNS